MTKNISLIFLPFFIFISSFFPSTPLPACTIFNVVENNGKVLVGRNFDSDKEGGRIWFIPSNGKYHGMAIIEQLGVNMPYEGINDKGLFVGIAAVPNAHTPFCIFKPIRKSLELVKIILSKAEAVDEALELFHKYTVVFGVFLGYPVIHYMIVDKEGDSAIVEFLDNKIVIIKNKPTSHIMTNHFVSNPEAGSENKSSFKRYNVVKENLGKIHSIEEVQLLLQKVHQKTTIWSNSYDLKNQVLYISYKGLPPVVFSLKDELYRGKHGYDLNHLNKRTPLKYIEYKTKMIFRPFAGYGYMEKKGISHYGARLLLTAGSTKRYGVEFTKFRKFFSAGIILEQRLFGWFNMSIGTVGYFNYVSNNENVIGIASNLGWEPDNHISFKPFVTYRSDIIFGKPIKSIDSISIGFDFEF